MANSISFYQDELNRIAESIFSNTNDGEIVKLYLTAESSDFIRFNKSKVRQITHVEQGELSIFLYYKNRIFSKTIDISKNIDVNSDQVKKSLDFLRTHIMDLPEDKFFQGPKKDKDSIESYGGDFPDVKTFLQIVEENLSDVDMAGALTLGGLCRANYNSLGQKHWYASASFDFDYSLYTAKERAVKGSYSGRKFDFNVFKEKLKQDKLILQKMDLDKINIKAGKYKVYLAPSAVNQILSIMSWGGLSAASFQKGDMPFVDYYLKKKNLSPRFSLYEDFQLGLGPKFNSLGEVPSDKIFVFNKGRMENLLTSSLSEKEFGLKSNQAEKNEGLRSPVIGCGDLKEEDILSLIGKGVYISDLHYLNWSDFKAGRITGMTRFACMWIENAKVVGPLQDMRFDVKLDHIFGDSLLGVSEKQEVFLDNSTYYHRAVGGAKVAGLLVEDFMFTL